MRGLDIETDPYWIHGQLLWEAESIDLDLTSVTHKAWYKTHLDNSIYRPLIDRLIEARCSPPCEETGATFTEAAPRRSAVGRGRTNSPQVPE